MHHHCLLFSGDEQENVLNNAMRGTFEYFQLDLHSELKHNSLSSILFVHFQWQNVGCNIGDAEITSLSESLKSNTTLTALYLFGEYKRKKTFK